MCRARDDAKQKRSSDYGANDANPSPADFSHFAPFNRNATLFASTRLLRNYLVAAAQGKLPCPPDRNYARGDVVIERERNRGLEISDRFGRRKRASDVVTPARCRPVKGWKNQSAPRTYQIAAWASIAAGSWACVAAPTTVRGGFKPLRHRTFVPFVRSVDCALRIVESRARFRYD